MTISTNQQEQNAIFGFHAVESLLKNQIDSVSELLVLKGRADRRLNAILALAKGASHISIRYLDRHALDRQVGDRHQGIVAICSEQLEKDEGDLEDILQGQRESIFLLILDGVTDPHNLGACIRSANAAGVTAVIIPKDKSARLNSTALKVACGAAQYTPVVRVTNLARTLKWLQQYGIWIVGAAGEAEETIYQAEFTGSVALVMGNEGKGLRRLTREHCDSLVKIPMSGDVSSLNVSVATGVCLFEALRQRQNT
ncbi:SAM-dependent 23S rRNA mG2251 2'-O-ribose methyltransferase [Oleiphilus messinensis]|uniref:23S rRNA (guanosine-2'-O-)-methyltransferase RlmB n=1 Tax=Oleiphilus messinensis TaxID=141451 RepID=A0A1Y0I3W0_9GAMM|nr:23S rRNA (guanosine(2251)-2'-O)-methyltransferase RlmB [Oleiphilus messinensis]ARU55162.1 SAM-dependent 23S rRNA mG2251 2'-O-ribose methyltransferase [Oleiphilus messinensis]